jgi:hypothetical protein
MQPLLVLEANDRVQRIDMHKIDGDEYIFIATNDAVYVYSPSHIKEAVSQSKVD